MSPCGVNPLTGKRYCDEKRERLAAQAKLTVSRAASGDISGAASSAVDAAKTLASGAAMMVSNGWTQVGGRLIKTGSANRRGDDNS